MRFLSIDIANFITFGPSQTVSLANQGLVGVFGQNNDTPSSSSNGAGKSSIMEAIVWVLYGETIRGLKGDEVVHKAAKGGCTVSLHLVDDNNQSWTITRTRAVDTKRSNDLRIESEFGAVTQGINVDTQEMVNTLVGMDKDTFLQSVLMCYGTKPFAELTDSAQKEALESILQIEQYTRARDVVRGRITAGQNKLATVNAEVEALHKQILSKQTDVVTFERLSADYENEKASKRLSLECKKTSYEAEIENQYSETGLGFLMEEMKQLTEKRYLLRQEEDTYTADAKKAASVSVNKQQELFANIVRIQTQIEEANKNCASVGALVGSTCPTCCQHVSPDMADKFMEDTDSSVKALRSLLAEQQEALADVKAVIAVFDDEVNRTLSTFRTKAQDVEAEQRDVRDQIQARSTTLQRICHLEQLAFNISEEIIDLDAQANPYTRSMEGVKAQIAQMEQQLTRLKYSQQSTSLELAHLYFWDKGFGNQGLKSFVIEGVLPFLNERVQHYADILTGGDLQIHFTTQKQLKNGAMRDEIQVHVTNKPGAEVYKGNSDGEKRRINTAVGWAFGDLAATRSKNPIRFRGLDEVFENLDEVGTESAIRLLHSVVDQYETIFCVTHSDQLQSHFDKILKVTKTNGFSTIGG